MIMEIDSHSISLEIAISKRFKEDYRQKSEWQTGKARVNIYQEVL